jgi:hypothetical protein
VKHLSLILFAAALLGLTSPADARSPAALNAGVCDGLQDATPGLYGLCVSFCEAQTCVPDFSLEDPFQNCKPSSVRLLEQYNRRKGTGDPEMPCVQRSVPCPCWSSTEITQLRHPAPGDTAVCSNGPSQAYWAISGANGSGSYGTVVFGNSTGVCYLMDSCQDGNCLGVTRNLLISAEQGAACQASAATSASLRGISCTSP